jgi:hypothetical protein
MLGKPVKSLGIIIMLHFNTFTMKEVRATFCFFANYSATVLPGHCNVPQHLLYECDLPEFSQDGELFHYQAHLGVWLSSQKSAKNGSHKTYKLSPERDALLQKLVDEGENQNFTCLFQCILLYSFISLEFFVRGR